MNSPHASLRVAYALGLAVAFSPAAGTAQQPSDGSIARRVEVILRTVTVVVTDAHGNPVATAPKAEDLEVLEDGTPAVVVGVDPLRPLPVPGAESAPAPGARPAVGPAEASSARRFRQVIYVDAAFLRQRSVKELAAVFEKRLPEILAFGPVEIVVADPQPRLFFPPSDRREAVRDALSGLAKSVSGRDRLLQIRRQAVDAEADASNLRNTRAQRASRARGGPVNGAQEQRGLIFEEAAFLRDGMSRLARWAASTPVPAGGVVWLASDGFDLDLSEFYASVDPNTVRNEVMPIVSAALESTEQSLAAGGWTAMPVALGSSVDVVSSSAAEFAGRDRIYATTTSTGGTFLTKHPLDPLRRVAEATGGEVVVASDKLSPALERLASGYLVSFQVPAMPDGKLHRLEVRSRRKDVVVRATRSIPSGTPQSASTARAVDSLEGSRADGGLPVEVALTDVAAKGKDRVSGKLTLKVTLDELKDLIRRFGDAKIRISVAVDVPGGVPFVWHQERTLPKDFGKGWITQLPVEWPKDARAIAVVAEEITTGSWGSARGELPKPN